MCLLSRLVFSSSCRICVIFFFIRIRRPPRSTRTDTLFPYTTLFRSALTASLERAAVDLVCLAGFMRVVTPGFVRHWQGRMINIHPSLLPSFPGLDTHARALAAGVKLNGGSVNYVRSEERRVGKEWVRTCR